MQRYNKQCLDGFLCPGTRNCKTPNGSRKPTTDGLRLLTPKLLTQHACASLPPGAVEYSGNVQHYTTSMTKATDKTRDHDSVLLLTSSRFAKVCLERMFRPFPGPDKGN